MTATQTKPHPFEPDVSGHSCGLVRFPGQVVCGEKPNATIHTGTRHAPRELEFPTPPCALCGEDTYHDGDGFRCDPCGASWGHDGRRGTWDDPDVKVCPSTHKPFDRPFLPTNIHHYIVHCRKGAGHQPPHRADENTEWEDDQ